jgi:hypothetical protein
MNLAMVFVLEGVVGWRADDPVMPTWVGHLRKRPTRGPGAGSLPLTTDAHREGIALGKTRLTRARLGHNYFEALGIQQGL